MTLTMRATLLFWKTICKRAWLVFWVLSATMLPLGSLAIAILQPLPAYAQGPDSDPAPLTKWQGDKGSNPDHPVEAEPVFPEQTSAPDSYGYYWDDSLPLQWVDAAGAGTQVSFGDCQDDCASASITIPFSFKFYEKAFTQVYASTNGMLTLGASSQSFANVKIPQDTPPNNLIAPFWTDLAVGGSYNSGRVSYSTGIQDGKRYLAVEWHQVTLRLSKDPLTFEAVLYENGDVRFQYQSMAGTLTTATVGIEDGDGVYGSLYLHAAPGIASGKSILFRRPAPLYHAKAFPLYQSKFTVNGLSSFLVTVSNSGEKGSDQYEVRAQSSAPGWQVSLYGADGWTPLADANHNGFPETGVMAQGVVSAVAVTVRAPKNAPVGSFAQVQLKLVSVHDSNQQVSVLLQSAVPAAFAQGLADTSSQLVSGHLDFIWGFSNASLPVVDWFSGSTLSVSGGVNGVYAYSWEKDGNRLVDGRMVAYSDIEYALMDRFKNKIFPNHKLTDNHNATQSTNDRYPASVFDQNGRIGLVWVRDMLDIDNVKTNSNVYFAVLDNRGLVLVPPVNLTGNNAWRGEGDIGVPRFYTPSVAAAPNGRFLVSWVDNRLITVDKSSSDVAYTLYDVAKRQASPVVKVTSSATTGTQYQDPTTLLLSNGNIFLGFTRFQESTKQYSIVYAVINGSGSLVKNETALPGGDGWGPDVTQMSSGKIFLAWTTPKSKIAFTVLDTGFSPVIGAPVTLDNPNPRWAGYLSATHDFAGNGIVTWMDAEWNEFLYYALVNSAGQVVTPPMYFYRGNANTPVVITNLSGGGNAPYDGSLQVYMPLMIGR